MNDRRPSWRERPENESSEAQYEETKDIGFAALAIGRWYTGLCWPEGEVPEWALEACATLYEKAKVGIEPVLKPTQGSRPLKGDRQLLERVARIKIAEPSKETTALFRRILKDEMLLKNEQLEHSIKRLMRYWGKELIDPEDGSVSNTHMNRVAKIDALARGSGRGLTDVMEDGTPSPVRRRPRRQSS